MFCAAVLIPNLRMDLTVQKPESLRFLIDAAIRLNSSSSILALLVALANTPHSPPWEDVRDLSEESMALLGDSLQLVSFVFNLNSMGDIW